MPNIECFIYCVEEGKDGLTSLWNGEIVTETGEFLLEIQSDTLDNIMTAIGNWFLTYGKEDE